MFDIDLILVQTITISAFVVPYWHSIIHIRFTRYFWVVFNLIHFVCCQQLNIQNELLIIINMVYHILAILFVPFDFLVPKILLNYLAFRYFGFERTWWGLFQRPVMRIKYDIYVFIPDKTYGYTLNNLWSVPVT